MSERSTGPTESRQLDEPSAGPSPAARNAQPIEVGGEPFALNESTDDEPATPHARRSRTKVIILSALLAVGLAGAAVIGAGMWRIASQKDATLVAPPQVATLRADQSDTGRETAEYLTTALAAEVDLDETVGAVYTDSSAADRGVLFFGGTTLIWTPESDLDAAFTLLADEQSEVTGLHEVEAGPLGGTMKCGMTRSDDGDISVCGWADHGSLALAMFPNRSEADSADLLLDIRSAAQTRQ
ncbi:MAG TPA: hypothetical protein VFH03_05045 [Actinoplanes sp.]|nr:hypothetical protein [Actinoplanes sp.]